MDFKLAPYSDDIVSFSFNGEKREDYNIEGFYLTTNGGEKIRVGVEFRNNTWVTTISGIASVETIEGLE